MIFYQKKAYKNAVIIHTAKADILKTGDVLNSVFVKTIPFGLSLFPSNLLTK